MQLGKTQPSPSDLAQSGALNSLRSQPEIVQVETFAASTNYFAFKALRAGVLVGADVFLRAPGDAAGTVKAGVTVNGTAVLDADVEFDTDAGADQEVAAVLDTDAAAYDETVGGIVLTGGDIVRIAIPADGANPNAAGLSVQLNVLIN